MRSLLKALLGLALFVLITTGALLIPSLSDNAGAQDPCTITIMKQAEGAGDTVFNFDGFVDGVFSFQGHIIGDGKEAVVQSPEVGALFEVVEIHNTGMAVRRCEL